MIDYTALKAADAALGIADPAASAAALNQQTRTLAPQPISKKEARRPLHQSGILTLWERYAEQAVSSLASPTAQDQLILLVQTFHRTLTSQDIDTIDLTAGADWDDFLQKCNALLDGSQGMAIPLLTADIVTLWTDLRTPTVPAWPETLNVGHIQTARNQP